MKRLSKDQRDRLSKLASEYEAAFGELCGAVTAYNQVLSDIEDLRSEIVEAIEEYTSERSDKWQESDAASQYEEWASAWQDLCLDAIDDPEEISLTEIPDHVGG